MKKHAAAKAASRPLQKCAGLSMKRIGRCCSSQTTYFEPIVMSF